ncbi:hypothetical protein ACIBI9_58765 [Nonomuraea sp. NPDC050451]|uniref:hypothetical protein n=1 Tax=Nonomuraea sp. NPDC050451 TaxID=3364364 RepID=UPI0037A89D39
MKAPTLVIEGSHEPVKPGHGAIIAERIPGARLMIVVRTLPPEVHEDPGHRYPRAHCRVTRMTRVLAGVQNRDGTCRLV